VSANPEELQIGQSGSMRAPKRWPLVTQPENRSTSFLKDARMINCYAEKQLDGAYQIRKRFGTSIPPVNWVFGGVTGQGQGLFNFPLSSVRDTVIAITGNEVYQYIVTGSFPFNPAPHLVDLGPIFTASAAGAIGTVKFCVVTASQNYLVFGSGLGGEMYYINGPLGAGVTQITDAFFLTIVLTLVPGIAYLDGTTYVMDKSGNIFGSLGFNDPTVWDPLNRLQANTYPDLGVCLAQQLVYIVALKSTSTQIFFDNGNTTGSPLSPLPGAVIPYGCASSDTVAKIDDVLFWVTNDINNVRQVGMMNNLQFQVISTPAIDRFLNLTSQIVSGFQISSFRSFGFKFAGHKFYVLTNVTANITMVYDVDQGLWYQYTDANGNFYKPMTITTALDNTLIVMDTLNGAVNSCNADYVFPNDNGTIVPVDIYTPNYDAGVDRSKNLSQMRFNADQTPGSKLQVRFSDNDYQTFNNFRTVDLSRERPILNDEGSFYRRAYHFRHLCNTPLRIRSVDLQMDLGTL
jgi:hypothetical protein